MSTMNADGTFSESPRCLEGPTCCGRVLEFEATLEQLEAVLGETDTLADAAPSWVVRVYSADGSQAERVLISFSGTGPRREPRQPVVWSVICPRDARWAAERAAHALGRPVADADAETRPPEPNRAGRQDGDGVATEAQSFDERVDHVVAHVDFGAAAAAKRGRNPAYPYVPVVKWDLDGQPRTTQLKGLAYKTREEAVARAQRQIDAERAGLARKLRERGYRALRESYGLPRELPAP
ncbi:hypothetical protein ACWDSJ_27730 [Nocardia sp. NPDC003482]